LLNKKLILDGSKLYRNYYGNLAVSKAESRKKDLLTDTGEMYVKKILLDD
jgi:hypothetical protein